MANGYELAMETPVGALTIWHWMAEVFSAPLFAVKKVSKEFFTITDEPPLKSDYLIVGETTLVKEISSWKKNSFERTSAAPVNEHSTWMKAVYPLATAVLALMAYGPTPDPVTSMLPPAAGRTKEHESKVLQADPVYI